MKKRLGLLSAVTLLVMALFALSAVASSAEMYFSKDKNGQTRVTNVQEGDEVFIVVRDADENIDCDVRDKIWTDIKVMDPKTGAYIVWISYRDENGDGQNPQRQYNDADYVPYKGHFPGNSAGWTGADYLEETGADTGLFVSKRSFQIGTRESYKEPRLNTHVVDNTFHTAADSIGIAGLPYDFQWGHYEYVDPAFTLLPVRSTNLSADQRGWFGPRQAVATDWPFTAGMMARTELPAVLPSVIAAEAYLIGRFENMNTLIGMYVDQNDPTDVATAMMKIIDTEATITWDQQIYKDANASATITIVDADENLNCNEIEYVPVFILVNPGSWNPVQTGGPNSFCGLLSSGGVDPAQIARAPILDRPIRWYNIYDSGLANQWTPVADIINNQIADQGTYFVQYPVLGVHNVLPLTNVTFFDTTDAFGLARVMFWAQETGVNTGVFQLNINSLLDDLGFNSLRVRDVLVAYYLDPNDFDDFKLAVAYIEEKQHSVTSFTNASRQDQSVYWLGRDPVYVQVIDANANVDPCCPEQVVVFVCDPHQEDDAEWLVLDETSSNSPVFFTNAGTRLEPVWDALGVGLPALDGIGGYQLQLDNWTIEAFNEDDIYVRYNDVYYVESELALLGDIDITTAFPPQIRAVRVANDVSFDVMSIGDTQVYDGSTTKMYFLDRNGNRVSGYVNSDCIFIEVVDPDQDEDQLRRERVDGYWDGGQNWPFGPLSINGWNCGPDGDANHPINALLGDLDVFQRAPALWREQIAPSSSPKIYVLNPRSGFWADLDILETGVATGTFVSVICVDLTSVYECVPTLGALPGDTIVAFYQDPSNHSDSAMISIKVGIGGGTTPPSQSSTTSFVNAAGAAVTQYTDADVVRVKVVDPSHAGATTLTDAVTVAGVKYSLTPLAGAPTDTFVTAALDIDLVAGTTLTATYVDPTDPTDTSSASVTIVASKLVVTAFFAGPSPATGPVTFGYQGSGTATVFSVAVYDLAGHLVWSDEQANVSQVVWDGTSDAGVQLANGGYIYVVKATDGTDTFQDKGTLFINR